MAILNNNPLIGASGNQGGYNINNSLRFRSSATASLSRTPASAGNRKTWTWSGWVKRGAIPSSDIFLFGNSGTLPFSGFYFGSGNNLKYRSYNGSSEYVQLFTTPVYRDPSAWYHIVVALDTTQATASNRLKFYVNGVQVTAFDTATYPSLNSDEGINAANIHDLGSYAQIYVNLDGYLADVNFIDGQALTPSSFGETDTTTGVWKPKAYSGTYGTNGFYLKFSDIATTSGSNAGLGKDFSGNSNYWTTNNISVTSGTTYDAMTDSPTLTSATVANYSTLNPLKFAGTLSSANLNLTATAASWQNASSTLFVNSGKWYFEATILARPVTYGCMIGIGTPDSSISTTYGSGDTFTYLSDGTKYGSGSFGGAYGATFTAGDVIGVAFDCDAGTITFYKNNVSQGTAFSNLVAGSSYGVWLGVHTSASSIALNCGQRPFAYTPPTGFNRLNTYNLPDSTIKKGNKYMDATLYTGTSATQTITNAGSFKPDYLWIKCRSAINNNSNFDSTRGVLSQLFSNLTNAESTTADGFTAFNSNGFSLDNSGSGGNVNVSGRTYVAWQWNANNGTTSSNTSGSITSTVQANTTAGFSIVTWTGNGTNGTIGHGLGVAPKMIIAKIRSTTDNWLCYHSALGATKYINLNLTNAATTNAGAWNNTEPTSSVFSVSSTPVWLNNNGSTYVAYCWAEIAGFSKFGSYTGNGSADGPFIATNFAPKFVLVKRTDSSTNGFWNVYDSARNGYNDDNDVLYPNSSSAEDSVQHIDLLSNGFKCRNATYPNTSGATYIYACFASNPFKNSLAR